MRVQRHCPQPVSLLLWHWRPGSPADETLPGSTLLKGLSASVGSPSARACAPRSHLGPDLAQASSGRLARARGTCGRDLWRERFVGVEPWRPARSTPLRVAAARVETAAAIMIKRGR